MDARPEAGGPGPVTRDERGADPADQPPGEVSELSDQIRAAQSGHELAFRLMYQAVQPGLLRDLRSLVGDDADDVARETWSRVAAGLRAFRGDGAAFRAWVATTARQCALTTRARQPADRSGRDAGPAQWLLDGAEDIDDDDAPRSLAEVLAAARGARPHEPRGEDAAVAAFQAARFDPPPSPRSGRPAWARVLTVKAIALAFLVAVASVGVAAGVRVVVEPVSSQNSEPPVRVHTTHPAPIVAPARPSTAGPASSAPALTPTPSPTSSPADLIGLCQAFREHDHPRPEDSGTGSPYSALIAAAGGSDNLAAFCAHLDAGAGNHPTHTAAPPGTNHHSPTPSTGPSYPSIPTNGG